MVPLASYSIARIASFALVRKIASIAFHADGRQPIQSAERDSDQKQHSRTKRIDASVRIPAWHLLDQNNTDDRKSEIGSNSA